MKDLEYYRPAHESAFPSEEIVRPPQEAGLPLEDTQLPPEDLSLKAPEIFQETTPLQKTDISHEKKRKERKRFLKNMVQLTVSAIAVMVTINAANPQTIKDNTTLPQEPGETESTSKNPVSGETTTDEPTLEEPTTEEAISGEVGDDGFPSLPNLEPVLGIPEPNYSGMSEEYVRFLSTENPPVYLIAGDVWGAEVKEVPGASYNLATNTLTLNNFSGQMLDVNLMGNSFTINLIGDNYLECIKVWGWNYGGSLTITGNGSLTVNSGNINEVGIEMDGEISPTCLMIDSTATLDVSGSVMAIYIYRSTMEKTIYYLKPMTMTGGSRGRDFLIESEGETISINGYNIIGDGGMAAKHVVFMP